VAYGATVQKRSQANLPNGFVAPPAPASDLRGAGRERQAESPATASRGPAVIRTARLQIIATDFSHVRSAVDVILDSTGGFADQLGVSADPGTARVLRGTLRVPGTRMTEVLVRLRALGQVTHDQQNAQEVSDQLVDLEARLRNARATEQRLGDLLRNRTGKLTDVLEVEQQVARIRLDIERLDAEKTNMTRRVAYATIDLTISEERKTAVIGPLSLGTQLRVAAIDGVEGVVNLVVGITLVALRTGPSLALLGTLLAALWMGAARFRRRRGGSPA
jgi:Ser-tRNA(Ala) deacylase AlaX